MSATFHKFDLKDRHWGDIKIFRILSKDGDPWGGFSFLKDTSWELLVSEVSGRSYEHAIRGSAIELMREVKDEFNLLLKKIPLGDRWCSQHKNKKCLFRKPNCKLGSEPPACYEAPFAGLDENQVSDLSQMVRAWSEGYHVIVVLGKDFVKIS